jgi:N-methylhydantoinase B
LRRAADPIELAIFESALHSIAVEMGAALRRTAFSPNIKERRDYSSAVFDADGNIVAMGDDMPVHLGSMPMSVRGVLDAFPLLPGDIAILNDPYRGGTHLPDITMVAPVFVPGRASRAHRPTSPAFYVANRAHHADVGGMFPGSMGLCREIVQEGIRIPPLKLVDRGELRRDLVALILNNVRTPAEREGDLTAQMGACRVGVERVTELLQKHGAARVAANGRHMLDHSEALMRALIRSLPGGKFHAEDFLDDDGLGSGPIILRVAVHVEPRRERVTVDFAGTDAQIPSSLNAVYAITWSAVFYVFRCLLPEHAIATAGLMRPVTVLAPEGSLVNAVAPAAVAGGNVETSQRIVDVVLRALAEALPERIPAASAGTMDNLTIGGVDGRLRQGDSRGRAGGRPGKQFAYYETIAGGAGASATADGASGTHTHMTNSLNTPVEALEYAYPFRVREYGLRRGSGGAGKRRGGDGLVRDLELLSDAQITVLADRRVAPPYGLAGGEPGSPGRTLLILPDGTEEQLPGKCNVQVTAGARIRIESPGGGGWGR